jgi:hypothetical protein
MSDVLPSAQHEYWRPPVSIEPPVVVPAASTLEACIGCGAEFMVGAQFCHRCGCARALRSAAWTRYLEFQTIKHVLGLPTASLIAFLIGVGCVLATIAVGMIYSIQNLADFEAVQLWRMQWLLAAIAAFVAGVLLKHKAPQVK